MMWMNVVLVLAAQNVFSDPSVIVAKKYNITVGYLPSNMNDTEKILPNARKLLKTLEEINKSPELLPDVGILFPWNGTHNDTSCSSNVAFFMPEGKCQSEDIIAEHQKLPMISYASKSVISLLRYYRWRKFSILYEDPWNTTAQLLETYAKKMNMTVNHRISVVDSLQCCEKKLSCCKPEYWYRFIQDTKTTTRIYIFLGTSFGLIKMMEAMKSHQLFANGEYMVIYVDMMVYSSRESLKYLVEEHLTCPPNTSEFRKRAQSLFVVVPLKPKNSYAFFPSEVQEYNNRPCFEIRLPADNKIEFTKYACVFGTNLYDTVNLYATALQNIIQAETVKKNKTLTCDRLINIATDGSRLLSKMSSIIPFKSLSGMSILQESAPSAVNFSLLAFKPTIFSKEINCTYNMIVVGHFQESTREFPVYNLNPRLSIDWPDNVKPDDEPACGFHNDKCPNGYRK